MSKPNRFARIAALAAAVFVAVPAAGTAEATPPIWWAVDRGCSEVITITNYSPETAWFAVSVGDEDGTSTLGYGTMPGLGQRTVDLKIHEHDHPKIYLTLTNHPTNVFKIGRRCAAPTPTYEFVPRCADLEADIHLRNIDPLSKYYIADISLGDQHYQSRVVGGLTDVVTVPMLLEGPIDPGVRIQVDGDYLGVETQRCEPEIGTSSASSATATITAGAAEPLHPTQGESTSADPSAATASSALTPFESGVQVTLAESGVDSDDVTEPNGPADSSAVGTEQEQEQEPIAPADTTDDDTVAVAVLPSANDDTALHADATPVAPNPSTSSAVDTQPTAAPGPAGAPTGASPAQVTVTEPVGLPPMLWVLGVFAAVWICCVGSIALGQRSAAR